MKHEAQMSEALALTLELEGTQLIEASAGTGKTWTLSVLLVRALLERDLRAEQILAVTFTRAATAEIKQRVLELLHAMHAALLDEATVHQDSAVNGLLARFEHEALDRRLLIARARRALAQFDELSVLTIHGFYQRTLKENALASGDLLEASLETNVQPELIAAARDFWRREVANYFTLKQVCDATHAKTLAIALLNHKTLMRSPEAMASWAKGLLQKAPQAKADAVRESETAFKLTATHAEAALAVCETTLNALRATFSPQGVIDAIVALRDAKRFAKSSYQKNHLAKWLVQIQDWLNSDEPLANAVPEKLQTHFAEQVFRASQKNSDAELPTELQVFLRAADVWLQTYEAWQAQLSVLHANIRAWLFAVVSAELPVRLAARSARSADGLALNLVSALEGSRAHALVQSLRSRYALVLVDEFQDTDSAQWAVMQRVFAEGNTPLLLVGDPKQAIYRFRGADIAAYLRAKSQARAVHRLSDNFRSTPQLLAVLNELFAGEGASGSFGDAAIRYECIAPARTASKIKPADAAFTVLTFEAQPTLERLRAHAVQAAVQQIHALLTHTKPSEIAVLVERNEDVGLMATSLARAGIAAAAQRRQRIASSFEALQFQWLLEALAKPTDTARLQRLMLTPLWGANSAALDDDEQMRTAQELLVQWATTARIKGPAAVLECVVRTRNTAHRWLKSGDAEAEEALARLRQVAEIVQLYGANAGLDEALRFLQAWRHGDDEPSAYAPNANTTNNPIDAMPSDAKLAAPRLASERAAVQVMTVHASKGLEFDAVVLPLLWAAKEAKTATELLSCDESGARHWQFGPSFDETALAAQAEDEAGERLRVAYVALTRARERCVVLWPEAVAENATQMNERVDVRLTDLAKPSKAQQRADASALGTLLGDRNWQGFTAKFDKYSFGIKQLADINIDIKIVSGDSINNNFTRSSDEAPAWPYVPAAWQTMSFSRLQRQLAVQATSTQEDDETDATLAIDRDETLEADNAANALLVNLETRYAFPRGAAAGRCLHAMLESANFESLSNASTSAVNELVAPALAQHGFADAVSASATADWLREIAHTALPTHSRPIATPIAAPIKLEQLSTLPHQREWEFHLPLKATTQNSTLHATNQTSLMNALSSAGAYSVSTLEATTTLPSGFFTGFVDLVFEAQGRYYVVDYKSNHLGNSAQDYVNECLNAVIAAHHYDVQAVLYMLALHRHLAATLLNYSPEQHLGGAFVLFLRGMHKDSANGVWQLKLDLKSLLQLAEFFVVRR